MAGVWDFLFREHKKISDEKGAKRVVVLDSSGEQITDFGARFGANDVESASSTLTYVGKEDASGAWLIMKIDESSGTSIQYATVSNNPTVTSYSNAWSNRATLTYGDYSDAF